MFSDFLAGHLEYEEQILESVQLEHICLSHLSRVDGCIECQWSIKRYVGLRDTHLQVVNQIRECRVAKETLAGVY